MIYNFHPLLLHERGAPPWEFWVLLGLFFWYLSSFCFSVWVPLLSDVVSELRVVEPLVGQVALVITGVVQIFRVVRWGNGVVRGAFVFLGSLCLQLCICFLSISSAELKLFSGFRPYRFLRKIGCIHQKIVRDQHISHPTIFCRRGEGLVTCQVAQSRLLGLGAEQFRRLQWIVLVLKCIPTIWLAKNRGCTP